MDKKGGSLVNAKGIRYLGLILARMDVNGVLRIEGNGVPRMDRNRIPRFFFFLGGKIVHCMVGNGGIK